jgi:hypothetical protein
MTLIGLLATVWTPANGIVDLHGLILLTDYEVRAPPFVILNSATQALGGCGDQLFSRTRNTTAIEGSWSAVPRSTLTDERGR